MRATWGRKETIVRPPQFPVYLAGAAVLAALLLGGLLTEYFYLGQTRVQQSFTGTYMRAGLGARLGLSSKYSLLYVGGAKQARARLAVESDFEDGPATMPNGRTFAFRLSPQALKQGYAYFFYAPAKSYTDQSTAKWLKDAMFKGKSLLDIYEVPLIEAALLGSALLLLAVRLDAKRFKQMKYGRRLRGPEMVTPKEFTKLLKGDGLTIQTDKRGESIGIARRSESKHIQIMGDTGSGKSQLLYQILMQIESRGDAAIVHDPSGEMTEHFFSAERGDWILNPLDARSPYWSPSFELRDPAEARTVAASLYQPTNDKKGEFFTETPQKVFAHLLKYLPTPQQLVAWMSNEAEIDARVEGTELRAMIAKEAPQQRSGVLASLGLIADSLRLLPTEKEAGGRQWSANEWSETRKGWIFLTSTETTQEALRPLHSLWIDLLIMRLLTPPKPGQKPAWFVLDELASLQRLPQFHAAITKGRKSLNPIVFTYQGKAQLEVIYGHLAEVMLSQPATKFVLKTAEPKAAKWASELLGDVEIERVRETVADGKRQGKSYTLDRQTEPDVMGSEIAGLNDLHAFVKQANYVSRLSFPYFDLPVIAEALVPRTTGENNLFFGPITVAPPPVAAPLQPAPMPHPVVNVQAPPPATAPQMTPAIL